MARGYMDFMSTASCRDINSKKNTMTKEIYDEFYKKHGVGVHADPVRFREIANLCKGRVLDIGCGTGDLADFYQGEYLGTDISEVAIKYAKENRRESAEFAEANFLQPLPKEEGTFDTFIMAEFLEHIEDDLIVFENIKKFANPNARIIISVPNGDRIPDPNHFREFTVPSLRKKLSPLGKVTFHPWLGFEGRILVTVDLGEKNEDNLTLSMIVWNEAKGLEKAILSCINFVDKVVISVDDKSDDGTLAIAERYADVVKRHEWQNDFALARNYVDGGITSKWILSLDGHEFVDSSPDLPEKLKQDVDGLMITMQMEGGDTFINPRIYRQGIKWEHAIHNALPIKNIHKYTDFVIVHDRLGGQTMASTNKRLEQTKVMMYQELKKELKIPASKTRALFYMARYYRQFHEWKKALKYYKKYLRTSGYIGERWLCAYEAGIIANRIKKPLTALKFLFKAHEIIPGRWEISKQIGMTYLFMRRHKKAVVFLVDSLKENTGKFSFNPEERNDSDTWDKIGFCFFQNKKYSEARDAWERSIEIGKDKVQNQLNKKRIQMLEREHLQK